MKLHPHHASTPASRASHAGSGWNAAAEREEDAEDVRLGEVAMSETERETWRPYKKAAAIYIAAGLAGMTPTKAQLKVIQLERKASAALSAADRAGRAGYHLRGAIERGERAKSRA